MKSILFIAISDVESDALIDIDENNQNHKNLGEEVITCNLYPTLQDS